MAGTRNGQRFAGNGGLRRLAALVLAAGLLAPPASAGQAAVDGAGDGAGLRLHVPSPDWRDQVVYFLMIDRFDDGDPVNNDQGTGEYDPADHRKFSGGDLKGVARRVDYIRGMGATAVWITPPVASQWWNNRVGYGGYHGYWADDFSTVDPHFGDIDDYRALSHALHSAGMYLVQDIVTNHVADYIDYGSDWRADDPAHDFHLIADPRGRTAPSQFPFSMNDARDPAQRDAAIYHWTPDIADYADPVQEKTYQMAGLDDLNTENPVVRRALRRAYGDWISAVGVDAFRVDTAFYLPPAFFADFLRADDAVAPGIDRVAAATGRDAFLSFGEGFGVDLPYEDGNARRIDAYLRDAEGNALLPGMINFPLYGSLGDAFARGAPSAVLAHRIDSMMAVHANPHLMPSFVDNHDVDRFLAGGSEAGLKQALLAIMALPGIPVVYYGTEQGFTKQRQAMFAGGWGSGGRDRFDADAPLYRFIRRATALRRAHPVLSRGAPAVLASSQAGPGALAWKMTAAGGDEVVFVALNTADAPMLLDNLDTGLPAGTRLRSVFAIDGEGTPLVVGAGGRVHVALPARHGEAWVPEAGPIAREGRTRAALSIRGPAEAVAGGDVALQGIATGVSTPVLVVDGDIGRAQGIERDADGAWQATLSTADMVDPAIEHSAVLWDAATGAASTAVRFRVEREWAVLADVDDPAGDDHGPGGSYLPPTAPEWRDTRPLDILGMRLSGSGGALRIELRMRDIVATWNPTNRFDHVAPTIFLQLPGRGCDEGSTVMPLQNASLPDGMCWHLRLRAHGWSNALFSPKGASPESEGTAVSPSAAISVDHERNVLAFTFPAASLGGLASLSGLKAYASTWDYDMRYRGLAAQPAGFVFGGGDGARDPLVMDDTGVVAVP